MATTSYGPYTSGSFKNLAFFVSKLDSEIRSSQIKTALSGIDVIANEVFIVFKAPLDSTDKAILDGDSAQTANQAVPCPIGSLIGDHDGVPEPDQSIDDDGNPVYAPTFLHTSNQARIPGFLWNPTPGGTSFLDMECTSQRLVQGAKFWIKGNSENDYIDFSVLDKNGIIPDPTGNSPSLMESLGLVPGVDVFELVKYVDKYYIPKLPTIYEVWKDEIIMPTVAPVNTGLFLRVSYKSADPAFSPKIGFNYITYIK